MINVGIVYGSEAQAKPLIVNIDTVYVHSDIKKVKKLPDGTPAEGIYKYNEIQYTKDEYIQLMGDRQELESELLTEIDINAQESTLKQEVESEMLTQHDIEILELRREIEMLKERIGNERFR